MRHNSSSAQTKGFVHAVTFVAQRILLRKNLRLGSGRNRTVSRQLELEDSRVVYCLAIVYLHVVAFLNRFGQVPVVVSHKRATRLIVENQHELVHVDNFSLDVNVPHAVPYFINSHPNSFSTRLRSRPVSGR